MNLPDVPEQITADQLNQALAALGINAEHLKRITIQHGTAELEYFRTNDHGGLFGSSHTIATVTTQIRIGGEDEAFIPGKVQR